MPKNHFTLPKCPSIDDEKPVLLILDDDEWTIENYDEESDLIACEMGFEPGICFCLYYPENVFDKDFIESIEQSENYLLHLAASIGNAELVQFFIDNGIDADSESSWGTKPIDTAIYHDHDDALFVLLLNMKNPTGVKSVFRDYRTNAFSSKSFNALGVLIEFYKKNVRGSLFGNLIFVSKLYRSHLQKEGVPDKEIDRILEIWWDKRDRFLEDHG